MHVGSIPAYMRGFMRRLEGNVDPGDIFIHNDPYHGRLALAGSVRGDPDLPRGRACCAWSASTIHLSDTGGVSPGIAIDVQSTSGPSAKIYDSLQARTSKGVRNEQLWQFFVDNTRTPS